MKNKQIIYTVLVLAVITTFITLIAKSRFFGWHDNMMNGDFVVSSTQEGPLKAPEVGIMPRDNSISPYYYDNNALDNNNRVYQKLSSHSVVVDDVSKYLVSIKEYILSIDGRVINYDINLNTKYNNGFLYAKVPVEKFDEATARVTQDVKKVMNENINTNDVTGQLVNTVDKLQSLKDDKSIQEAALKDAKTQVEKRKYQIEIDRLEKQIAAAEKNINRVENKTKYSTISIFVSNNQRYFNQDDRLSVTEEFFRALSSLKSFIKVAGYFGVWIIVYSVIWFPVIWVFKKLTNKNTSN